MSKILHKLHDHIADLSDTNYIPPSMEEYHPIQSINKFAPFLPTKQDETNVNIQNYTNHLSTLQLCIVLLSELELIAISKQDRKSWKLNKDSMTLPLHIDCSFKVLSILYDILDLSSKILCDEIENKNSDSSTTCESHNQED